MSMSNPRLVCGRRAKLGTWQGGVGSIHLQLGKKMGIEVDLKWNVTDVFLEKWRLKRVSSSCGSRQSEQKRKPKKETLQREWKQEAAKIWPNSEAKVRDPAPQWGNRKSRTHFATKRRKPTWWLWFPSSLVTWENFLHEWPYFQPPGVWCHTSKVNTSEPCFPEVGLY